MKETLQMLANYNIWANSRIIDVLLKQSDEILDLQIVSSFTSIRETVYHTWGAESIWLQRLQLAEHLIWKPAVFTGTMQEACHEWKASSKEIEQFIEKQFDDAAFEHVFQYNDLKQQPQKKQVKTALLHVFNHATYHRGQLVTMLRQAGVTKIPGTDFILFNK